MSKCTQDPNLNNLQTVSFLLDPFIFFLIRNGEIANLDFIICLGKLYCVLNTVCTFIESLISKPPFSFLTNREVAFH